MVCDLLPAFGKIQSHYPIVGLQERSIDGKICRRTCIMCVCIKSLHSEQFHDFSVYFSLVPMPSHSLCM